MNKFKQFCLLLCLVSLFCVGYLSLDSYDVYAYETSDNFYPLDGTLSINVLNSSNSAIYSKQVSPVNGKYSLANSKLEDIKLFNIWFADTNASSFTFPYNPDIYDYYFVGTLTAMCYQESQSTFKPTVVPMYYYSYDSSSEKQYTVSDANIFNIDSNQYKGFGFVQKVDFAKANSTSIGSFRFSQDVDGVGVKPANLVLEVGIMAVDKSQDEAVILSKVLKQLQTMETSLSGAIGNASDSITDTIEGQYAMDENDDLGVGDLQTQVEDKMGVLNFGADTLVNFLDLFSASSVNGTQLTFPAFTINVGGSDYTVWNDITFDLSSLEEHFGTLISMVRIITVLCVWLAVLSYLVKAKDHFINGQGG